MNRNALQGANPRTQKGIRPNVKCFLASSIHYHWYLSKCPKRLNLRDNGKYNGIIIP